MLTSSKWVDMTQTISSQSPTWEGRCGFECTSLLDYHECTSALPFRVQEIKLLAGVGTHIDAPCHCFPKARDTSQFTLKELCAPAIKIDVTAKANENYVISSQDILDYESIYGPILAGTIVLLHTGWQRYWDEPERYRNQGKFPHLSLAGAQLLIEKGVVGLAIDTLSPDNALSNFPVHRLFLGSDRFIIENMCGSEAMPAKGGWVLIAPLKAQGLSEAPIRLFGCIASN